MPPCAAPGFELVQVGIENECQYPQSIHYWWTYVRDGVERTDGPYGITLPGSSWTYLCLNTQLVQSVDGYVQLDGYVRGVNLCEPAIDSLTGWVNKVWCCDEDLNCTEVYDDPVVPDGSCSPPGGP